MNYNDPFGLSPMKILTPYINFVHDALNLVSVIPGPIGYVADAISAGMYYLEGKEKAALKMLVMAGNNIATGGLIGKLSSLGSKGRLLASSFFIGTGAKGMASSGASFVDNFMGLIDSISNGDDILTIFHYASGTVCDAAGMYYGAKAFAGGYKGASSALDDMDTEWYRSRKGHAVENSDIEIVTYDGNKMPQKRKDSDNTRTYYHVTTRENAQKIIDSGELGIRGNKWESRVFAWSEQPTKRQASIAGIGKKSQTVIRFSTNASFEPDVGNASKSIANIVVQTSDGQRVPIQVSDVEIVGFKKAWWQFWK